MVVNVVNDGERMDERDGKVCKDKVGGVVVGD